MVFVMGGLSRATTLLPKNKGEDLQQWKGKLGSEIAGAKLGLTWFRGNVQQWAVALVVGQGCTEPWTAGGPLHGAVTCIHAGWAGLDPGINYRR